MIEASTQVKGYCVSCPKCGKEHCFFEVYVDRVVECECGFGFYAFVFGDFRIIMSKAEAENESIVRSMRQFVVSTGRCLDIPPHLYEDASRKEDSQQVEAYLRCFELEDALEEVLESYQLAGFGEYLLTRELLDSILESLSDNKDIELKRKKDSIEIIELKKKRVKTGTKSNVPVIFRRGAIDTSTLSRILSNGVLPIQQQKSDMTTPPKL